MRNSNSRETRRAVEAYVLEELEAINERSEYDGKLNPARPVSSAFETIREEMDYQSYIGPASDRPVYGAGLAAKYDAAGRHDHYAAATPYRIMWLYAAIGNLEAYTGPIYQRLRDWLDETPEESDRYTDTEAERLFYHLTASAFERLYTRETEPRRIPTSEFKRILQDSDTDHHFFDRATMRYHRQTMRDITVTGFYLVTDMTDHKVHDCYKVESMQASSPEDPRHLVTYYFDRETLKNVFPKEA